MTKYSSSVPEISPPNMATLILFIEPAIEHAKDSILSP